MDTFFAFSSCSVRKIAQRLYPTHAEGSKRHPELCHVILGGMMHHLGHLEINDSLPAKLWEGNDFTWVCLCVHKGVRGAPCNDYPFPVQTPVLAPSPWTSAMGILPGPSLYSESDIWWSQLECFLVEF